MVIVMVTMYFIYRPLIPRETFNLWMMRFVHLWAQIGFKPIPCLNLNGVQTFFLHHTISKWSLYRMVITYFLLETIILTTYIKRHVFVDSIIVTSQYDDIPSLLTTMHEKCSYLLVSFHLYIFYILYFRLYYPKSNHFNIFQVDRIFSHFYQFDVHFVSDAKHWHHVFDFLKKTTGSKKL